jgi:hypothetical protein
VDILQQSVRRAGDDGARLDEFPAGFLQVSQSPAKAKIESSAMVKQNGVFTLPSFLSSRRAALPPTAPLRTVRESFHLTRLKPS